MTVFTSQRTRALSLVSFAALMCVAQTAYTQDLSGTIPVQHFTPNANPADNYVSVQGAGVGGHMRLSASFYTSYAYRPLTLESLTTDDEVDLVRHMVAGDLSVSLGLFKSLELAAFVPMTFYQVSGESSVLPTREINSFALGDIRVMPKWKIYKAARGFGVALLANTSLPTGDENSLQGNGSFAVEPRLVMDYDWGQGQRFSINAGYLIRGVNDLLNIDVGNELTYGAAYQHPFRNQTLFASLEFYGKAGIDTRLDGSREIAELPLESILALRWIPSPGHNIILGGGPGLTQGYGSPVFRTFLGYSFGGANEEDTDGDGILDPVDQCPARPEDKDDYKDEDGCPDLDNDKDGILDFEDKCPMIPEDKDGYLDGDGCPEADNDKDGIPDKQDKCPLVPETFNKIEDGDGCPESDKDKDGIIDQVDKCPTQPEDKDKFEDEDGCPDPDNDKDGIPDVKDKCPMDPEDKDGFEDEDGCPELDNDKDGVPDAKDKCPTKPETFNGYKDEDGCPERRKALVDLTAKRIVIKERIFFDFDKDTIKKRSYNVLNVIGNILKMNPQIKLVRIEGHTDDQGTDAYNLDLSKRRAASVRKYLIKRGIDENRLNSEGYGEGRPLCQDIDALLKKKKSRKTKKALKRCRATNRRVEFLIINKAQAAPKPTYETIKE